MKGINLGKSTCPRCQTILTVWRDRRNVCTICGADYGRVFMCPIKLKIVDEEDRRMTQITMLIEDLAKEC